MSELDLTPDQLAYIRAAAARWRMDEAGPMMLEALRNAEAALDWAINEGNCGYRRLGAAIESVRAAIAAAE